MKRNHSRSKAALAAILGMAGLGATGQIAQASQPKANTVQYEATPKEAKQAKPTNNPYGGPLGNLLSFSNPGLTPKEYGIRFGNGKSRNKKPNKLRYSANAKIRRRLSC